MSLNNGEIQQIIENFPSNMILKHITQKGIDHFYFICHTLEKKIVIFLNIHDGETGIFMVPETEQKQTPKTQLRFSEFLTNRLSGGRIEKIYQPNYSRIVVFTIKTLSSNYHLICRLWGTAANLFLVDKDQQILDLAKRYPKRNEWVGEKFVLPEIKNPPIFSPRTELIRNNTNQDLYFYYQNRKSQKEFSIRKEHLQKELHKEISSLEHFLEQIEKESDSHRQEQFKKYGELLSAYLYQIKKGAEEVTLEDFETSQKFSIQLDPSLSPQENCRKYFEKYKKIKSSIQYQTKRKIEAQEKLHHLRLLSEALQLSETLEELNRIEIRKKNKRKDSDKAQTLSKTIGRKFLLHGNFTAYLSRSAKEADLLLKTLAKGNDYWFHIRDNAGSHLILKNRKDLELPDKTKLEAAMLALHFSKSSKENEGDIYFTRVKYLHKPNTNTPGLVFPSQEKNIRIKIDPEILGRLLKQAEIHKIEADH